MSPQLAQHTSNHEIDVEKALPIPSPQTEELKFDISSVMALAAIDVNAWLIVVAAARNTSKLSEIWIMAIVCSIFAQVAVMRLAVLSINAGWPNKGSHLFAGGTIGFGLALLHATSRPGASFATIVFHSKLGWYLGLLLEARFGSFGALARFLNRTAPANRPGLGDLEPDPSRTG